jgi:hypothetical protein
MKHALLAVAIAVFGLAGVGGSLVPAAAQQSGMQNVTGDWVLEVTGDRFLTGTLHLTQVGNTIIGSAEPASGQGVLQVNGTLAGQTWSAKWRGPTGATGWLTAHFNNKGTSFSGEGGYNGRPDNGRFVSKKFVATAF